MPHIEFKVNNQTVDVKKSYNTYRLDYPCDEPDICYPYITNLPVGCYSFSVWGSAGATKEGLEPGYGGFANGSICLNRTVKTYFQVGSYGTIAIGNNLTKAGYNGGGKGKNGDHVFDGAGGGASDIRFLQDDYQHRAIVAGGGGGSGQFTDKNYYQGGCGGGSFGEDGVSYSGQYPGGGASETNGGISTGKFNLTNSTFGEGATHYDDRKIINGCGGGGGWYGGGAGVGNSAAGGGGSGFVFTDEKYSLAMDQGLLLTKEFLLHNAVTISGCNETYRNEGKGYIIIKVLSFPETQIIRKQFKFSFITIFPFIYINTS